ncbi:MAG: hypothetical protein A3J65_01095 [Candidatus Buchananbacteria bacterium RIFCSPHIGHO2_02_FULL_45_11b]|uniref:HD domain-containing protein n=3 Tax=Candidatus Buchananiibacteriota TaxID=1817903 RepID=A0A1G1YGL9_9BACT|nr:MAG: hypothetical protein A2663_00550 [Candidatus Buchananbacteria bacterium RIFCSPHIGHO2_01_FULL_46_12]OGY51508.1 MAG: hypothetical protein A3J65_01095 [Candidatus Buchananbacteria bacterium RIFCSPHIGHO2_02_FULL_45_11b]OGY57304.1 MAG: hypothetical protein A3H67_01690 [Candidatus Buchananbacteria bacterium RIFCSPLOWO2_02_FULL_46_11b]
MQTWTKNLEKWAKIPFLARLAKQFPQAEVFLVGGAVRDAILGRPTKDFDFVVRGVNKNDLEKFLGKEGKVNLVGKRFGVFKFRPKGYMGEEIDIALPRTEHSLGQTGAYRDFKIQSNANLKIEDDLSRRDFTINAMAFRVVTSNKRQGTNCLVDPFNGLDDLKKGVIRTVGKPELRFREDYSRLLRAVRFACQLNFEIETKTWKSILKNIKNLNKKIGDERIVPYEVIAKELIRAVNQNPLWSIELLDKSGALKILMPELLKSKGCPQPKIFHSEGDCWIHMLLAVENLFGKKFKKEFKNEKPTPEVIWGAIFHDIAKPYTITMADRLRFNNHDNLSAKMFRQIAEKLKLSAGGLNIETVEKIINKHMLAVHSQVAAMKDTTLEKYFFNPNFPGQELLMLIFADISATIPPSGRPDFSSFNLLKKRIAKLAKKSKNKKQLPKPILNGHDLIKTFKLKSSPQIGQLLLALREAQLSGKVKTKKQGLIYVKKLIKVSSE